MTGRMSEKMSNELSDRPHFQEPETPRRLGTDPQRPIWRNSSTVTPDFGKADTQNPHDASYATSEAKAHLRHLHSRRIFDRKKA